MSSHLMSLTRYEHRQAPAILALTEPKTCEYSMMIATQHVCGDPAYPVITASGMLSIFHHLFSSNLDVCPSSFSSFVCDELIS
jgi:hypothetical protein